MGGNPAFPSKQGSVARRQRDMRVVRFMFAAYVLDGHRRSTESASRSDKLGKPRDETEALTTQVLCTRCAHPL